MRNVTDSDNVVGGANEPAHFSEGMQISTVYINCLVVIYKEQFGLCSISFHPVCSFVRVSSLVV